MIQSKASSIRTKEPQQCLKTKEQKRENKKPSVGFQLFMLTFSQELVF